MTRNADTNARIHSLWALQGLGALKPDAVLRALQDKEPRVRLAAVQLAEPWLAAKDGAVETAVKSLGTDSDAQVATQVFLAWRATGQPGNFQPGPRPLPLVTALQKNDADESLQQKLSPTARQGRLVYESLCMACHGLDGMGVKAAEGLLAPPLAKSAWMENNGNVPVLSASFSRARPAPSTASATEPASCPLLKTPTATSNSPRS